MGKSALDRLRSVEKVLSKARDDYESLRVEAQLECEHPVDRIVQADSTGESYRDAASVVSVEFRVCTDCGYAEEGWGCGYSFLAPHEHGGLDNMVSVAEAREHVRGGIVPNDDHAEVKFGRKELSEVVSEVYSSNPFKVTGARSY